MTNNKRFTLTNPKNAFQAMKCGIDDGGNTLIFNEVVDLLNELHEENVFLKEQRHKDIDDFTEMVMKYKELENKVETLTKENWELEQENEKLENRLWNCQNVR